MMSPEGYTKWTILGGQNHRHESITKLNHEKMKGDYIKLLLW